MVLDGAISLAVPTKFGQSLTVERINEPKIIWKSFDEKSVVWFENEFVFKAGKILNLNGEDEVSNRLIEILNTAKGLNPKFLQNETGFKVSTKLDFPKNWGLGTSSTLINNIANWAQVDAYILLEETFGGSGYDIACAQNNTAITYQLNEKVKQVTEVGFNPMFKDNLYFVYLNKKQNSRDGIKHYREHKGNLGSSINEVNSLTKKMIACNSLEAFKTLIEKHEAIIARVTKQRPIKDELFSDFKGAIKSLGAWGGDFILSASNENPVAYFKAKGFDTVIADKDMAL